MICFIKELGPQEVNRLLQEEEKEEDMLQIQVDLNIWEKLYMEQVDNQVSAGRNVLVTLVKKSHTV